MSIPTNPLNESSTTSYRHILIAFKYASDAVKAGGFDPESAEIGSTIQGSGENVVIVNEFLPQTFSITEALWEFDFIPEIHVSTTSNVGKIVVADQFVPYGFMDFLHNNVLDVFNGGESPENKMALSHATFVLKTYFITDGDDPIKVNPYFFNIESIESVSKKARMAPNSHIINAIGTSNSLGLMRSFNSLYQMDITHKDGNIHNEVPKGTGTSSKLRTRKEENDSNEQHRKERLDKSKPMVTLKDVFDGLETDLNQLRFSHQAQLQQWIREIRNDSVDKIIVSPKQTKEPNPESLPIKFNVDLDSEYNDYVVNNRNMPFEQPEIDQEASGVRVYPVRPGQTIYDLVDDLMLLSQKTGDDAVEESRKTHKTTITAIREKDGYIINVKIRKYELPHNVKGNNLSAPGTNRDPLSFFVNDPLERDTDIVSFKSHINYEVGDKMLEQPNAEVGANIVYADREQATAERRPDLPFYQTLYSGLRPMVNSYNIDGLENAKKAGDVFNMMDRYTYTQTTEYEMIINGNPLLLSDLNRNPQDVIDDVDGLSNYYVRPEVDPMFIKLTIFLESQNVDGDDSFRERFYYDDYYHVTKVVNMFGVTNNGRKSFYQNLIIRRSDLLV